jgi:hypothetical protein
MGFMFGNESPSSEAESSIRPVMQGILSYLKIADKRLIGGDNVDNDGENVVASEADLTDLRMLIAIMSTKY